MNFKNFVGIDVSKATIDAFIHGANQHRQFPNAGRGFEAMCVWIRKVTGSDDLSGTHFSFEHTGLYSLPLAFYLEEAELHFSMVSALRIKRTLGMARGKNDMIDAKRIAEHGYLYRESLPLTSLPAKEIMQLQSLLALRDRLVRHRAGFEVTQHEQMLFLQKSPVHDLYGVYDEMRNHLTEQITRIDGTIRVIVNGSRELKSTFDLITTIKGVGKTVALYMIVFTHNFTRFENWRKFACYCGTAPFENTSGVTYVGKTRVSTMANRQVKKMLHMAAVTASIHDKEMRDYYQRRVDGGKSKMATLNIIRNKILSRVFAVALRKSPYIDINKFAD